MTTLFVSTRNQHKLQELRGMLQGTLRVEGVDALGDVPEIDETADTFEGNAVLKATCLARFIVKQGVDSMGKWGGYPIWVLADDSGLSVDHLKGAPGVHSARFAWLGVEGKKGNAPDSENNSKVLGLLKGVPVSERTARFVCALALLEIQPGGVLGNPLVVVGNCEGRLREELSGQGGFGYDPLFEPLGHTVTFAQLSTEQKNRISHRSRALEILRSRWPSTLR